MPNGNRFTHPALFASQSSLCVLLAILVATCLSAADWPQWGGRPDRNMVSDEKGLPESFDPGFDRFGVPDPLQMRNVVWFAPLGSYAFGTPVVADGRVYVGTNNAGERDPRFLGDRGILLCLRETDGRLLWKLMTSPSDYRLLGHSSSPTVEGDRLYVLTARAEVLCLDVHGLENGNDGPFTDEATHYATQFVRKPAPATRPTIRPAPSPPVAGEGRGEGERPPSSAPPSPPVAGEGKGEGAGSAALTSTSRPAPFALARTDADIIWRYDLVKELKVQPHDTAHCNILIRGNYLYLGSCHNLTGPKQRRPGSTVPNFIALDKRTGRLAAIDDAPVMKRQFHGQWSSPALATVNGRDLLIYGAGDGFCYAFEALPHPTEDREPLAALLRGGAPERLKTVWWFDCNPPEYLSRNGQDIPYAQKGEGPSEIIATPVIYRNRAYVAIGQDTLHGPGKGCLSCFDITKTGDVSLTGLVWRYLGVDRSISTAAVADGCVYIGDRAGVFHCVDAETGRAFWTHDTKSPIWSSPLVADGKVYVGNERGQLWIFAAGREKKVINTIAMRTAVHATPVAANGVLYVASSKYVFAVKAP